MPTVQAATEQQHVLYRFFDAAGVLLYVGLTNDPGRRFGKHRYDKTWWAQVARITLEHQPTREALVAAERAAIKAEKPVWNDRMNNDRPIAARPVVAEPEQRDGLVGRWFHSWEEHGDDYDESASSYVRGNKHVVWQGRVMDQVDDHSYLVQTFSWWDGSPYGGEILVTRDQMADWTFYPSSDAMQIAMGCGDIDHGGGGGSRKCRNPATHVIRGFIGTDTSIFACWRHIKHYSGTAQEL